MRIRFTKGTIPLHYLTTTVLTLEEGTVYDLLPEKVQEIKRQLQGQVVREQKTQAGEVQRFIVGANRARPGEKRVSDLLEELPPLPPTALELSQKELAETRAELARRDAAAARARKDLESGALPSTATPAPASQPSGPQAAGAPPPSSAAPPPSPPPSTT